MPEERQEAGEGSVLADEAVVVALVDFREAVEADLLREVEEVLEEASREDGVKRPLLQWFFGVQGFVWYMAPKGCRLDFIKKAME